MADNTVNFKINIGGNAITGIAQIDDALDNLLVDANKTKSFFTKLTSDAFNFNNVFDAVNKITAGFQSLVGTSLDFEQQQANIRTLLNGDAEAADNLVSKIKEFGKATVYDRSSLVEAQKTMMSFGLDADFAFGKLKNIGDIALGDSEKMKSLALAFSQATSTGKLMGQDLLQMINAGFNPLEVISSKTGKSIAVLKDEMSKGAISADMIAQAFEWATEEGGRFYQGAEMAAQTVSGSIAKMKDTVDEWKVSLFEATGGATAYIAEVGQMLLPLQALIPLLTGVRIGVKSVTKALSKQSKVLWKNVTAIWANITSQGVMTVMGGITTAVFGAIAVAATVMWAAITGPIGLIVIAIAAVVAVFVLLWQKCEGFRKVVFGVWEAVKAIFYNIWVVIKTVFELIWNGIIKPYLTLWKNIFVGLWEAIKWVFNGIVSVIQTAFEWIKTAVMAVVDFFVSAWTWVTETVSNVFNWIVEKLGAVGVWIKEKLVQPIKDAFSGVWDFIKGIFDKILDKLLKIIAPIKELWNKIFPKDKFKDVSVAYNVGVKKGEESWKKSQEEKEKKKEGKQDGTGSDSMSVLGDDGNTPAAGGNQPAAIVPSNMGKTAGESSGKVSTVNIKLESMVSTMNFNGGLKENASDIESRLQEMMARILGMAETAV